MHPPRHTEDSVGLFIMGLRLVVIVSSIVFGLITVPTRVPPPKEDVFLKIGRMRAKFGDKPNSGVWKWMGSDMIFPVGRADRRFYVTPIGDGRKIARLCCESKHAGTI